MNETPTTNSRKRGRPASGITKDRPSLTIDTLVMNQVRRAASKECMSVSQYVERAVRNQLTHGRP